MKLNGAGVNDAGVIESCRSSKRPPNRSYRPLPTRKLTSTLARAGPAAPGGPSGAFPQQATGEPIGWIVPVGVILIESVSTQAVLVPSLPRGGRRKCSVVLAEE